MKLKLALIGSIALILAACGGEPKEEEKTEPTGEETKKEQQAPAEKPKAEVVELTIEANDDMKFNKDTLKVPAGSKVKLTLKNVGVQPKESMGHNWTLLASGVDVNDYGMAAAKAADNGYQPKDRYKDRLEYTLLLGPGEEDTIEFDAPEPGTYTYICTFPGHYGSMQGKFIVE